MTLCSHHVLLQTGGGGGMTVVVVSSETSSILTVIVVSSSSLPSASIAPSAASSAAAAAEVVATTAAEGATSSTAAAVVDSSFAFSTRSAQMQRSPSPSLALTQRGFVKHDVTIDLASPPVSSSSSPPSSSFGAVHTTQQKFAGLHRKQSPRKKGRPPYSTRCVSKARTAMKAVTTRVKLTMRHEHA